MIDIPSTVKISLRALRVNKMRSALTMGDAVAIQKECSAVLQN